MKRRNLMIVLAFAAALLVGLSAAAVTNAEETPTRVFHIGIVSATQRSRPEHVAFEDRLRELGYVEGRNLTIDFVQDNDPDRLDAVSYTHLTLPTKA